MDNLNPQTAHANFYYLRSITNSLLVILALQLTVGCNKSNSLTNIHTAANNVNALQASTKPNIILILGDDVGFEVPTVNGGQSYTTPNLDKMAQDGMRFTQVRSSPLCSPSRVSLLTGKYNFRNYTVWGVMDTTNRTIANMLQDQGYSTLVSGKWQLDGGDASIKKFGFDDYMIYNPFAYDGEGKGSRYKDPSIYKDGAVIPRQQTAGLYGEDMFESYAESFIDQHLNTPFFIYYTQVLTHDPFSPTPLDPEFAGWDSKAGISDPKFYPSMAKYMDIKIGQIINKVKSAGLANNTIIFYVGDNGTSTQITSRFMGQDYQGGKTQSTEAGTHVPMFALWPGKIAAGSINRDMINFTDFLPTIAGIANIPVPANYGTLDGISFYPRLLGQAGTPRSWTFNHYQPEVKGGASNTLKRWTQDTTYKQYDGGKFYNIILDPKELSPIKSAQMTAAEKKISKNFKAIMSTLK